jgi:hypothetical protein
MAHRPVRRNSMSATVEYLDSFHRSRTSTLDFRSEEEEEEGIEDTVFASKLLAALQDIGFVKDDASRDSRRWTGAKRQVWRIWQAEHGRRILEDWRRKRLAKGVVDGVGWRERVWRFGQLL